MAHNSRASEFPNFHEFYQIGGKAAPNHFREIVGFEGPGNIYQGVSEQCQGTSTKSAAQLAAPSAATALCQVDSSFKPLPAKLLLAIFQPKTYG